MHHHAMITWSPRVMRSIIMRWHVWWASSSSDLWDLCDGFDDLCDGFADLWDFASHFDDFPSHFDENPTSNWVSTSKWGPTSMICGSADHPEGVMADRRKIKTNTEGVEPPTNLPACMHTPPPLKGGGVCMQAGRWVTGENQLISAAKKQAAN